MPDSEPSNGPAAHAFPRAVRLKRRRLIRPLFDRSRDDVGTLAAGCIRLLYRIVPREATGYDTPVQVGFAPGRTRTAVRRNRLRRLMREVYRVHQHPLVGLFAHRSDTLTVMVLFRGRAADPACIRQDLPEALRRLARRLRSKAAG